MIISVVRKIGSQADVGLAAVVGLAVGNGGGRILAGMLSDKLGRKRTMCLFFVCQAALVLLLSQATADNVLGSSAVLVILTAMMGANYGSNLSLFPSVTKDYYGLKDFGTNYGLVFTAWGAGGFMLALLAATVYDKTQSFNFAYYLSAVLLVVAAVATILLRPPNHMADDPAQRSQPEREPVEAEQDQEQLVGANP